MSGMSRILRIDLHPKTGSNRGSRGERRARPNARAVLRGLGDLRGSILSSQEPPERVPRLTRCQPRQRWSWTESAQPAADLPREHHSRATPRKPH